MTVAHADLHREAALSLYQQRTQWLVSAQLDGESLASLERRLRVHLHVLGRLQPQDQEPQKEAEAFVYLAALASSPDIEQRHLAQTRAREFFVAPGPLHEAAFVFFSLFPPSDEETLTVLYDRHETLRPVIFSLWHIHNVRVPQALLNMAATQENAVVRAAALRYAAEREDIGLDLFRTAYAPTLQGGPSPDGAILDAALWGGLLRADPDISRAIGAAITHATDGRAQSNSLRLAALSGNPEFLPILREAAIKNPKQYLYLLALTGRRDIVPDLFAALGEAHTLEPAAEAWAVASGRRLPRIPRLNVVGEEGGTQPSAPIDNDSSPLIPDARVAHGWWQQHQKHWKPQERWIAGKPFNAAHLAREAEARAGHHGADVLALFALEMKKPVSGLHPAAWRAALHARIEALAAPATPTVAKPASATTGGVARA